MGNQSSQEVRWAVFQDGEQNVKQTAYITSGQVFLQSFIDEKRALYESNITKKQQQKEIQINQAYEKAKKKYQDKKLALQTHQTGTIQHLQQKNHQSFDHLSGYTQAIQQLDDIKKRQPKLYQEQKRRLLLDIDKFRLSLKDELQGLKKPLPQLTNFGQDKKQQVLNEIVLRNPTGVQNIKHQIEQRFQKQFEFDEVYRKRFEQWVPKRQMDQILDRFDAKLSKLDCKKQKSGYFGCF